MVCLQLTVEENGRADKAEFAFYVNKNGWRSKPRWAIIWEGVPTAFGMCNHSQPKNPANI